MKLGKPFMDIRARWWNSVRVNPGHNALTFTFVPASTASKSGKTKLNGTDVACTGRCNLSFTVTGELEVKVSKGNGAAYINGREIGSFKAGAAPLKISLGSAKKVVRLTGSNMTVQGLGKVNVDWTESGKIQRKIAVVDPSLEDKDQLSISNYGFQIADFNQDYQLLPISRGTTLLDATLDVCSGDFPSEKFRVLRRQVAANSENSQYSFTSTETVKYKDATSAASALTDIDNVIAKCKVTGGAIGAQGLVTKYVFSEPPKFVYANGVSGRVILTLIGEGVNARWLLGFFQIKGDLAVNTYLVRAEKFTDADIKRWVQVASEISTRLSSYTPVNLTP